MEKQKSSVRYAPEVRARAVRMVLEHAGCELLQYRKVELGQREVRQARRELADHADTGGLTADQGREDRGHHRNHQRRRYAGRQAAQLWKWSGNRTSSTACQNGPQL
jgi:hypothetical protein